MRQPLISFARSALCIAALVALAAVAGCAGEEEKGDSLVKNITKAYDAAQDAMRARNYRRAIPIYEALQAQFPFSDLSKQIQLELMYAYYKSNRPEQAVDLADQFMRENPIHPRVDYALYVKALTYFNDEPGFLERWFNKDTDNRPPEDAALSFSLFKTLVERYPASIYAGDARQRMIFLKNRLAAYENTVARFYLDRGAYVAALNRARETLGKYNGATGMEETLSIMVEAYEGLGMDKLAADARQVLQGNFPNES